MDNLLGDCDQVQLVRAYPYRTASLRDAAQVPLSSLEGLWLRLTAQAGWDVPENHCVFVFRLGESEHAVQFSDELALLGAPAQVVEARG